MILRISMRWLPNLVPSLKLVEYNSRSPSFHWLSSPPTSIIFTKGSYIPPGVPHTSATPLSLMRWCRSNWPIRWCESTPPRLSAWAGHRIRPICWLPWRGHSGWGRNECEPCQSRGVASISPCLYHSECPKWPASSPICRREGCLWTPHRYRDRSRTQTHAELQGWRDRRGDSCKTTHRSTYSTRGCYWRVTIVMRWSACAWRVGSDGRSVWRGRWVRGGGDWPRICWQIDSYYNESTGEYSYWWDNE